MKDGTVLLPLGFMSAVKEIKLAVLLKWAKAAHFANNVAPNRYTFVGVYISRME